MLIHSYQMRAGSRIFAIAVPLLLSFIMATGADEPSSPKVPIQPQLAKGISKVQQRYLAQYAEEDRQIATLALEDRNALVKKLSKGMRPPSHPSDPVPETTFQMCLNSRRLARLVEELSATPEASKTPEMVFDNNFRELQESINAGVETWAEGVPPKRFLPIYDQHHGVCAGLFLCMEHASLDATLKRIDLWQNYGQHLTAKLLGLTLSEAALEKLSHGKTSQLVDSLRKDPQRLGVLLNNDVGRCGRPEPLFLVNVYIRLMQKHCQSENVIAELPVYFQKHQRPQVIPMWSWRSHPIASSLAHQFAIESIEEDRSLQSFTVYTGWGFLQDEQKQKLTTQVRERLQRCRDQSRNPAAGGPD